MTDLNFVSDPSPASPVSADVAFDLIELLFFAYRDFVGDADEVLADRGFGRAHHRVLHFVNRHPGMSVAELLDILRITKQSLARVLRELIDSGFIVQREGVSDRRQRLLHTTESGSALALKLARMQSARIARALEYAGPAAREEVRKFLSGMIAPDVREALLGASIAVARRGSQPENGR